MAFIDSTPVIPNLADIAKDTGEDKVYINSLYGGFCKIL